MSKIRQRAIWGSKLGFLLAAIGSAVGLGNIWKFSYTAYKGGGGAFLVPYIVALFIAGLPLLILEYTLGHSQQGSTPLSFAKINKKMEIFGWWLPVAATFGVLLLYMVVIAWCFDYFLFSFSLEWGQETGAFFVNYLNRSESPFEIGSINFRISGVTAGLWFLCWLICVKEINHGIEKACMVFIPLLLLLTTILVICAVSLDGAALGIEKYLYPDWGKINIFKKNSIEAWKIWSSAFGQTFFTLSLGFGIMVTYSSYLPKKTSIVGNAVWTAIANCTYSIFAGFAVFGVLGFMAGQTGEAFDKVAEGGPGLAFVVYPNAITQLPFGEFWNGLFGATFFLALVIAGLSSAVSLLEAFTCSLTDKFRMKRWKVVSSLSLLGFLGSIIFTTRAGLLILDIVLHFIENYALLTGGIIECFLVGYMMKAKIARKHIEDTSGFKLSVLWDWCIMFITPVVLLIIISQSIYADRAMFLGESEQLKGYEGYPIASLWIYGVGALALTLLIAAGFTVFKWRNRHIHTTDEEQLLT